MSSAACASSERDERETMSWLGSAMEWRSGRPAAQKDAVRTLVASFPPDRWRRWRRATGNDGEAR